MKNIHTHNVQINLHSLFLSIAGWSGLESTIAFGGDDCLIAFVKELSATSSMPNNGLPDGVVIEFSDPSPKNKKTKVHS